MDENAEMAAWLEGCANADWKPLTTAELADQCVEFAKALARYKAIKRWRKKSGSRHKYKDIVEEYLAWLPEERRNEFGSTEVINGVAIYTRHTVDRDPDPITIAMVEDGWTHPLRAPMDSYQSIFNLVALTGLVGKSSEV